VYLLTLQRNLAAFHLPLYTRYGINLAWPIVFKWQRDDNVEWRPVIWSGLIDCMKLDITESLEHTFAAVKTGEII
jgi:hypothetical protein